MSNQSLLEALKQAEWILGEILDDEKNKDGVTCLDNDLRDHAIKTLSLLSEANAAPVAAQPDANAGGQKPERMTIDQSKEYLIKFMERHFTDKTFHRYIRGERNGVNLAGDFAWHLAHALRMTETTQMADSPLAVNEVATAQAPAVADRIVALSKEFAKHSQLNPVIGREALILRCVEAVTPAAQAPEGQQEPWGWAIRGLILKDEPWRLYTQADKEHVDYLCEYRYNGEVVYDIKELFAARFSLQDNDGMPVSQEPKYGIRDGRLFNRSSGDFIPADEPVFIFRARDMHAVNLLADYARTVSNADHAKAVWARVDDFKRFWAGNPDRMKQPDTDVATTQETAR